MFTRVGSSRLLSKLVGCLITLYCFTNPQFDDSQPQSFCRLCGYFVIQNNILFIGLRHWIGFLMKVENKKVCETWLETILVDRLTSWSSKVFPRNFKSDDVSGRVMRHKETTQNRHDTLHETNSTKSIGSIGFNEVFPYTTSHHRDVRYFLVNTLSSMWWILKSWTEWLSFTLLLPFIIYS